MILEIIEYDCVSDPISVWNNIVINCSDAWIWSTHVEYEFRISVLKASKRFVGDKSFFVAENGIIIGFAPLVLVRSNYFDGIQASYDKPLPWPIIINNVTDKFDDFFFAAPPFSTRNRRYQFLKKDCSRQKKTNS